MDRLQLAAHRALPEAPRAVQQDEWVEYKSKDPVVEQPPKEALAESRAAGAEQSPVRLVADR